MRPESRANGEDCTRIKLYQKYDEWKNYAHYIPSRRAATLFMLLEQYVNQAIRQYERIQETMKVLDSKNLPILFSDCHFYFISINKVSELVFKFYDVTGFEEIIDVLEKNKKYFKMYDEIRNHYEHIEERTTTIKQEFASPKRYLSDFGNIHDEKYSFGGKDYDISEKSIITLKKIYETIIEIVKKYSGFTNSIR